MSSIYVGGVVSKTEKQSQFAVVVFPVITTSTQVEI